MLQATRKDLAQQTLKSTNFTVHTIICKLHRALRYPNVKMKKRFEPDYGSGATGYPPEDTECGESMRRLTTEEQDLLMKIFQLKREIRVSVSDTWQFGDHFPSVA